MIVEFLLIVKEKERERRRMCSFDMAMYQKLVRYAEQHLENPTLWINPNLSKEERKKLDLEMFGKVWDELTPKEKEAYTRITHDLEHLYRASIRREML